MVNLADEKLYEFTKTHDQYISDWNDAMESGDTSALELMAQEYYVAFFNNAQEKPTIFSKNDAILGMRQSVAQLLGARKKFEHRVIRLKDTENAVVFYELVIEKEDNVLARLFTIENWQCLDGKWLLMSEIEKRVK